MATDSLSVMVGTGSKPVELDSSETVRYIFERLEIGNDSVPILNVVPLKVNFADAISMEAFALSVVSKVR